MAKARYENNTLIVPIRTLIKKYKKYSGYTEAKKMVKRGEIDSILYSDTLDDDMYICHVLQSIAYELKPNLPYVSMPSTDDVYSAFREALPVMFKALRSKEMDENRFVFDWLKKDFRAAIEDYDAIPTEQRIMLLKMMKAFSPKLELNIYYPLNDDSE